VQKSLGPLETLELENALARLRRAIEQPKNEFICDSVIQRFEFTVELSWKEGAPSK
jgi:hypothetical protein